MRATIYISLLIPFFSFGQHLSKLGRFSIDYSKGCLPVTIHVTKLDGFGSAPRTYFYEEDEPDTPDTLHTYFSPDTIRIVQLIGVDITPKTDTLEFIILESPPPAFHLYACSGNTLSVEVTDTYYDFYRIYFSATDSVTHQSGDPNPDFTYPTQNANVVVKGFFNNAYSTNCGTLAKQLTLSQEVQAPALDSVSFQESCYGYYDLSFFFSQTVNARIRIELLANGAPEVIYEGVPSGILKSSDIDISSNSSEICFRVSVLNDCDGSILDDFDQCFPNENESTSPSERVYATYSGDGDFLVIHLDSFKGFYSIETSSDGAAFSFLKTVTETFTTSEFAGPIFRVTPTDSCNSSFDSYVVSAPVLRLNSKNNETNQLGFSISDPVNNLTLQDNLLIFYSADSTLTSALPVSTSAQLQPEVGSFQQIRLRYEYTGGEVALSNVLLARMETFAFAPRAFSPNGDGLNDTFEFFGTLSTPFSLRVFNKWGDKIFETEDPNQPWDGLVNGHRAPQGTYQYKLTFASPDGKLLTQVGTFVLIK